MILQGPFLSTNEDGDKSSSEKPLYSKGQVVMRGWLWRGNALTGGHIDSLMSGFRLRLQQPRFRRT